MSSRQRSIRVHQHLCFRSAISLSHTSTLCLGALTGIAINALVELLICHLGFVDTDLVADHEAWRGFAGDDQVAEIAVVLLHVALAGGELETLEVRQSVLQRMTAM